MYFSSLSPENHPDIIDNTYLNEFIELMLRRGLNLFAIKTKNGLPQPPQERDNSIQNSFQFYNGLKAMSEKHCTNLQLTPEYREIISDEAYAQLSYSQQMKEDVKILSDMLTSNPRNFMNKNILEEIKKYSDDYQSTCLLVYSISNKSRNAEFPADL